MFVKRQPFNCACLLIFHCFYFFSSTGFFWSAGPAAVERVLEGV